MLEKERGGVIASIVEGRIDAAATLRPGPSQVIAAQGASTSGTHVRAIHIPLSHHNSAVQPLRKFPLLSSRALLKAELA